MATPAVLLVNAKQTRCRSFVFNAFAMFGCFTGKYVESRHAHA